MPEPVSVFLSYVESDRDIVSKLYTDLKNAGFSPWMADKDLLPGMNWKEAIYQAIQSSDAFLICLSEASWHEEHVGKEIRNALEVLYDRPSEKLIIPTFIEMVYEPEEALKKRPIKEIFKFQAVTIHDNYDLGLHKIIRALGVLSDRLNAQVQQTNSGVLTKKNRNFQISKIELSNIRCFEELVIDLEEVIADQDNQPTQFAMILGDNAAGKTTLLRSLALGLCNQTDAAVLMRSTPGNFIRQGVTEGTIKLTLKDVITIQKEANYFPSDGLSEQQEEVELPNCYTITTTITKQTEDIELIRQNIEPENDSLEEDIFICGYGANRIAQSYTNYDRYRIVDAVQSLFSKQPQFHNAEVVLLRRTASERQQLEKHLLKLLMLDEPDAQIHYTERGIELSGPWGRQSLQVLSDGYRSTSEWLLDFMSWAIQAHRLTPNSDIGGILLIDELEQHLHPRWQRFIVQRLRELLPKTQIIASTHTPLVTSGLADIENGVVLKLNENDEGQINVRQIPSSSLAGKRADQILVSDAFGLFTSRNPGSQTEVDRYTELLSNPSRTAEEEEELQTLLPLVQQMFQQGERDVEQLVHEAVNEALDKAVQDISPGLLDLEVQKQLQQLSQPKTDNA